LKAASAEVREHDGWLAHYGHDPDDELEMDWLLREYRDENPDEP
jgi:hypothetical protein